jgi:hypothetical protein
MIEEKEFGDYEIVYNTFQEDGLDFIEVMEVSTYGSIIDLSMDQLANIVIYIQDIKKLESKILEEINWRPYETL